MLNLLFTSEVQVSDSTLNKKLDNFRVYNFRRYSLKREPFILFYNEKSFKNITKAFISILVTLGIELMFLLETFK